MDHKIRGYKTVTIKSPAGREIKAGELKAGELYEFNLKTGRMTPKYPIKKTGKK